MSAWLSLCYAWAFAIHLDSGASNGHGADVASGSCRRNCPRRLLYQEWPSCSSRLLPIKGQVDLPLRLLEIVGRNAGKGVAWYCIEKRRTRGYA